jgi:hypothetical protein
MLLNRDLEIPSNSLRYLAYSMSTYNNPKRYLVALGSSGALEHGCGLVKVRQPYIGRKRGDMQRPSFLFLKKSILYSGILYSHSSEQARS